MLYSKMFFLLCVCVFVGFFVVVFFYHLSSHHVTELCFFLLLSLIGHYCLCDFFFLSTKLSVCICSCVMSLPLVTSVCEVSVLLEYISIVLFLFVFSSRVIIFFVAQYAVVLLISKHVLTHSSPAVTTQCLSVTSARRYSPL
jgi:hypothetical protein